MSYALSGFLVYHLLNANHDVVSGLSRSIEVMCLQPGMKYTLELWSYEWNGELCSEDEQLQGGAL